MTNTSEHDLRFFQFIWIFCFLFGVASRFWNIFNIGMIGSDEFYYWDVAYNWSKEGAYLTGHYRPFIYYFYSFIMKVLGTNDWSIKLLNVTLDLATSVSLYFVYKLYFKDKSRALLVSALYLIIPVFIFYSRRELVHTPSIFFLLLTLLFFPSLFLKRFKFIWVFLSGTFFSLAWNTHPDLFVLFPIFLIFIFIFYRESLLDSFFMSILFTVGAASVFLIFSLKFHPFELILNILKNHKAQNKISIDSIWIKWVKIYYLYIKENLGFGILCLFSVALIKTVYNFFKGYKNFYEIFLLTLILDYMIMCGLFFSRIYIPRLLLPLCSLILVIVVRFFHKDLFKNKTLPILIVSIPLLLVLAENVHSLDTSFRQEVSYYRRIEDLFGKEIDSNKRLLVAPIIFYHIHGPLTKKVYMRGESRYLVNAPGENFADIIEKNKIGYVLWANENYDERIFGKNINDEYINRLKSIYGLSYKDYNLNLEHELFVQEMNKLGAQLILSHPLGDFYKIKKGKENE